MRAIAELGDMQDSQNNISVQEGTYFGRSLKIHLNQEGGESRVVVNFNRAGFCAEGKRGMITKLEDYKKAKANAFIHVRNLDSGNKGKGCHDA